MNNQVQAPTNQSAPIALAFWSAALLLARASSEAPQHWRTPKLAEASGIFPLETPFSHLTHVPV